MIPNNGTPDLEVVDWIFYDTLTVFGARNTEIAFQVPCGPDRPLDETNGMSHGSPLYPGHRFVLREIWADVLHGEDLAKQCTLRLTIGAKTYLHCPLTAIIERPLWFPRAHWGWADYVLRRVHQWFVSQRPHAMRFQYPPIVGEREPLAVTVALSPITGVLKVRICLRGGLYRYIR